MISDMVNAGNRTNRAGHIHVVTYRGCPPRPHREKMKYQIVYKTVFKLRIYKNVFGIYNKIY